MTKVFDLHLKKLKAIVFDRAEWVEEVIWPGDAAISRINDRAIQPGSMPENKPGRRSHGCFENETREF